MIAADRRRKAPVKRPRGRLRPQRAIGAIARWTRRVDRTVNRGLERAHPPLRRGARVTGTGFDATMAWLGARLAWAGRRLRRPASVALRGLARLEAWARRAWASAVRAATAASAVVTPRRAAGAVILAAGLCLVVSQFLDLRGIEIGQPGYAELPGEVAAPPTVDVRSTGDAHSYLLVPVGLLGALLGAACMRRERPRWALGAAGLGLLAIVVILAVDLPSGLDVGAQSSRFAGATAVLKDGFYAELAAAAGMVLAGLLYYARPCRIRISSSGRAASARRRRPRRRASSRARVARSA
jgi:hypothetical protein